jgi:chloramphenicol-sensitive protein RarD
MTSTVGTTIEAKDESRAAVLAGIASYSLWGFLPLYFHLLSNLGVGSWEMIAHRTLWSVVWAGLLVWVAKQGGQVTRVLREPRTLLVLAASTAAIFTNWSIYVFAVNAGHVLETSLGYYINPLLNMAAGAILFREKIDRISMAAIGLAFIGVLIQTLALGHLPLVSLGVAGSFLAYAILRKQVRADAQTGLFIETAYLALPGLAYVLWLQHSGAGHFTANPQTMLLLLLAGPATVAPLALFAWSARRMPLSAMGFLQFLAPTIQFALGVALGEAFTPMRALSFAFIWLGAGVFAYGAWRRHRAVAA